MICSFWYQNVTVSIKMDIEWPKKMADELSVTLGVKTVFSGSLTCIDAYELPVSTPLSFQNLYFLRRLAGSSFSRCKFAFFFKNWPLQWRNLMIDWKAAWVWDPVTWTSLNSTFSNKLLIDRWCTIFESVNQISDHVFKCLSRSLIWTVTTEFVVKFRFPTVLKISPTTPNFFKNSTTTRWFWEKN